VNHALVTQRSVPNVGQPPERNRLRAYSLNEKASSLEAQDWTLLLSPPKVKVWLVDQLQV